MKFSLIIIFLLITPFLFAQQNLVPNPSFEEYINCPDNVLIYPTNWYTCSGTPDYYNVCDTTGNFSVPNNGGGYQYARNGVAYFGFYTVYWNYIQEYKEYIGCDLLSPLEIGTKYYISFFVSLSDNSNCSSNNIGLLLSTTSHQDYSPMDTIWGIPTNNYSNLNSTSIISNKQVWTEISGSIIADSAYKYLIIGNFFDKYHTDTTMFNTSTAFAYYYIDDIYVSKDSIAGIKSDFLENSIKITPNPATSELTINYISTDKSEFELYDVIGAKRKAVTLDIGSQTKYIDLTDIDSGLYFYSVVDRNGNRIKTGKLIVTK